MFMSLPVFAKSSTCWPHARSRSGASILALERELRALQHPAHDAGVDGVFLRLRRLGGNAADLLGVVDHFQKEAHGIAHADAGGIHFRVDDAGGRVHAEFLLVLRVRQAGHEANAGDGAVGTHVAIHAGGGAQGGVGRLARDNDLLAAFVDHEIAGGGPLQRGVIELAEPVERSELGVVAELRHHRYAKEGQAEHVKRHQRAIQGKHVGKGVRHRLDAAGRVATLPDDGIVDAARLGGRALVNTVEHLEQVAVLLFLGDFE
ncbi:MAG: hypothetical protein NT115_16635 [Proteobacteria bacterium]|nr:hypothetical protein [Pseudomonadota bacterium]